jgi:hypothetical protein
MEKKRILLWVGLAGAAGAAVLAQYPPAGSEGDAALPGRAAQAGASPEASRLAVLPPREPIGKPQGQLFGPRSWAPAPAAVAAKAAAPLVEKPSAPPIPYRIAGQVMQEDGMRVVLTKGDRVFEVREGQMLEGGFRLESVTPHVLTFVYVPLGIAQQLPVAGVGLELRAMRNVAATPAELAPEAPAAQPRASASQPAQLRFDGPQQVQAGKPFDVALKLTSPQPVRALPVQLSFDAKRLEPLAVRAGELFAGGNFTYRVNRAGSIFVGASGSGRAAADSELLVVTFRPILSGPAELKVSSLLVQGAAGRAIAHEPPQAFRAAVVQ